jgi:hypothetical protein
VSVPTNVGSVTVTGTFINLANGAPASGTVTFEPAPCQLVDASADAILIGIPVVAALDADGSFTVELAATDDPDLNPVDWTYLVTVRLTYPSRGWRFAMAAPAGATIDLADVVPIESSSGDAIIVGPPGPDGPPGPGVPVGGNSGEVLAKASTTNFDAVWVPASAPGAHAATHAAGSSDPVTVVESQVTGLTADLAAKADKSTTIATTLPLNGGGDLSTGRTLTVATFTGSAPGVVPTSVGGSVNFLRADGSWAAPAGGGGGGGITTEEAVDAVALALTEGVGIDIAYDDSAGTITIVADKTEMSLNKSDVGLSNVDNTTDALKPVSTATSTALALKADKTQTLTGTAPITTSGSLGTSPTIAITDFTATARGAVPNPTASSGRFLKDDGTWSSPASVISGVGGVFPFSYNTSTSEPPTGNQLRGNNSTFTSSTKLWVMETTTDGLDVAVGLGRIKAGFQVYIQDYTSAARYALFSVTADSVDKGAYWELTVAIVSSAGTIPSGKVALQSLSAAQANNTFSTTTTAAGLAPGSNGAGATTFLNGNGGWTTPLPAALNGLVAVWKGTQAQYDAIGTKDPNTLYAVTA